MYCVLYQLSIEYCLLDHILADSRAPSIHRLMSFWVAWPSLEDKLDQVRKLNVVLDTFPKKNCNQWCERFYATCWRSHQSIQVPRRRSNNAWSITWRNPFPEVILKVSSIFLNPSGVVLFIKKNGDLLTCRHSANEYRWLLFCIYYLAMIPNDLYDSDSLTNVCTVNIHYNFSEEHVRGFLPSSAICVKHKNHISLGT